jgi:hypothetical protein
MGGPGRCDVILDSPAFPRCLAAGAFFCIPASGWHRKPATARADRPGWPTLATFRSPFHPGTEEGRATKEGNKR